MEGTSEQQQPQGFVQYPPMMPQMMPYFYPAGYPQYPQQMYSNVQPGAYPYAFVPQQELPEMPVAPVASAIPIVPVGINDLETGFPETPRKKACSRSSRCRFVPWILFGLGFFFWFLWVVGIFWMRSRHTTARRGAVACAAMVLFSVGLLAFLFFRHNPIHRYNDGGDTTNQGYPGAPQGHQGHHHNHHQGCHGAPEPVANPDDPVSDQPLPLSPIVQPAPVPSQPETEPSDDRHGSRPEDHHRWRHGNDDDDDDDDHWRNHDNNRPSEHNHHEHHHEGCHAEPQAPVFPPPPVAVEPSPFSPIVEDPIAEPVPSTVESPETPVASPPAPNQPSVFSPIVVEPQAE